MDAKILIVEDEVVARTRLQAILDSKADYEVVVVDSAGAAAKALKNQSFDVILLDIHLPDADDFELAAQIGNTLDLGLIIISAADDDHNRLRDLRSGADDHLSKPYNSEEL